MIPNWRTKVCGMGNISWVKFYKIVIEDNALAPQDVVGIQDKCYFTHGYKVGREWLKANLTQEEWVSYCTERLTA